MILGYNKSRRILLHLMTLLFFGCQTNENNENDFKNLQVFSPRNYDHLDDRSFMKIGFGSCLDQKKPLLIFDAVKAVDPDFFIMLGDNVYGDTHDGDLTEMSKAYDRQKINFHELGLGFPIEAIWDDHDYGLNDAGGNYVHKVASEQLFFDFWEISNDDIRRTRPGLYREQRFSINGNIIQIIYLDTRYFRGELTPTDEKGAAGKERYVPSTDTTQTMLGEVQWVWLKEKLGTEADYRLIISSIQFLAVGHGWECWQMMPHERRRMIALIDSLSINNTLFISGDRHRGGLYQLTTPHGNTIHEITSSPLNATTFPGEENGVLRKGSTYTNHNFGMIKIDVSQNLVKAELLDQEGQIMNYLMVGSEF